MDYDYSKRGCLLPEDCKDLVDVIRSKTAITERGFEATVPLWGLTWSDIGIIAEGNTLRIITQPYGSQTIEVPSAYLLAGARGVYLKGRLRVVVPKAEASTAAEPN